VKKKVYIGEGYTGGRLYMDIPWPPKTYSRKQEKELADKIAFWIRQYNPGRDSTGWSKCEGKCRDTLKCLRYGACHGMDFFFPKESEFHEVNRRKNVSGKKGTIGGGSSRPFILR
jgi:hypothetical protein